MKEIKKRLFFGCEASAPWPIDYPSGRIIDPSYRHLTLAFLGNVLYSPLEEILPEFPGPPFKISPIGFFDQCLFLPKHHPHVAAWNVKWLNDPPFESFRQQFAAWLKSHHYPIDRRPFLPHVTIARSPFSSEEWKKSFTSLPMMATGIHLYESVGNLVYKPLWSLPFPLAFEEVSHTADLAFHIKGETMEQLHLHAEMALAFKHPPLIEYIKQVTLEKNLDDIVMALNELISISDQEIGSPFKAVSFHGDIEKENNILKWEMIVDV